MTKEALKIALDALEVANSCVDGYYIPKGKTHLPEIELAITAIKEALARPEQSPYHHFVSDRFNIDPQTGNLNIGAVKKQEPVAWRAKNFYENQEGWFYAEWHQDGLTPQVAELLYTTPPQRTWVGLTEREQGAIMEDLNAYGTNLYEFAQAIEAKLRSKNESKN